jgi:type IV pilus assembly protein PilB
MARKRKEITDILVDVGAMKANSAEQALRESARSARPLHEVILDLKLASEEEVTKALAYQYDMEYIDLDKSMLAASNFNLIPPDLIKKHQVLPLDKKDGVLRVVIGDPTDIDTIDALKFRLNTKLETCLGVKSKIKAHIDRVFAEESQSIDKAVRNAASIDTSGKSIDIKADGKGMEADDAPIIKLVAQMITEAVKARASDIHVEPMKDRVRIRYRIDGVCVERDNIAKRMQPSPASSIWASNPSSSPPPFRPSWPSASSAPSAKNARPPIPTPTRSSSSSWASPNANSRAEPSCAPSVAPTATAPATAAARASSK